MFDAVPPFKKATVLFNDFNLRIYVYFIIGDTPTVSCPFSRAYFGLKLTFTALTFRGTLVTECVTKE